MICRILFVAFFASILGACSTTNIPLKESVSRDIRSVDQYLVIPQEELRITVTETNAGNTGLIGALIALAIDESRASGAKKKGRPMLEELEGYDFRAKMQDAIKTQLVALGAVPFAIETDVIIDDSKTAKVGAAGGSSASAVMFSSVDYKVESGNLIINLSAEMFPLNSPNSGDDSEKIVDPKRAIYRQSFNFIKQAVTESDIRAGLDEGIENIAFQIASDLSNPI
ncbi:MAG: hypothetical protein GXP21_04315 [Gammaproteobacteria bacterium]|nr:hypothetical protein [Gammaproteobacteria bacterium]